MRVACLAAGIALCPAITPLPAIEPFLVRFVAPVPSDTLIGKTRIEVAVEPPDGSTVLKVELYADDKLIGTMLDPPWTLTWDAGDSLKARALRARAFASNGQSASGRVSTAALKGAQRARVTLVEVYCTVRDAQGSYLQDLKKEDFTLLEAGRKQEIAVFSAGRKPVQLVLLIDTSASMRTGGRMEIAREAAAGFVDALEPMDAAALVAFSDSPLLLKESTSDKPALVGALQSIEATGGTALYDSILAAVDLLKGVEGKKAIILLSDGRDESADGLGPGSSHTFDEALDAVLRTETTLFAVGTGEKLEEEPDYEHRRTVGDILSTLSARSGGRAYFVKKASRLKDAYGKIADELRHQYTLAYYPPGNPGDGPSWRPLQVKVTRPRAKVTARSGYFSR